MVQFLLEMELLNMMFMIFLPITPKDWERIIVSNCWRSINQEEYTWSYEQVSNDRFYSSLLPYIGLTFGENPTKDQRYTTYALRSAFGRLNYTFKNRYIIEANGRNDGSSRFPQQRRHGFFPSISAAWIASEESFFQNISNQLSSLKFRASYGDLGNQNVEDFGFIQTLPTGRSSYLVNGGFPSIITGAPRLKVDPRYLYLGKNNHIKFWRRYRFV